MVGVVGSAAPWFLKGWANDVEVEFMIDTGCQVTILATSDAATLQLHQQKPTPDVRGLLLTAVVLPPDSEIVAAFSIN